jgi:23S rRNA (guanosine2251-2'-O)-methyltransferase
MYLYGHHACQMALLNSKRKIEKVFVTQSSTLEKLPPVGKAKVEIVDRKNLENRLPPGAVHQGIALSVQPLPNQPLDFLSEIEEPNQRVIVLDHVSDPHNVGAILRSSAVFGASALIMTERHAPKESGVLAKSASGALELVPICVVGNLAQGLKDLKTLGFWCVGFAESGKQTLDQINLKGKIALVLGGEGEGMRRLTQENCDFTVRLPSANDFSTLNVSNAAAIALYDTYKAQNKI